ncbi:MAG TPA: hypothetical protein VG013_40765 [Gemmataceae bacterium]|nr:hypothetical protein [Gemmataceae bacterium]
MPRSTRVPWRARIDVALVMGLLALGMFAPEALAQRVQTAGTRISSGSPGFFPYYQVAPGLNINQAAYNTALMGQAYGQFPRWAAGFASPYALGYSPFGNPGVAPPGTNQAIANSALLNPGLAYLATGSGGGYGNPYLGSGSAMSTGYGGGYGAGSAGYSSSPYSSSGGYSDPTSGYLRGSADVIGAQGRFKVSMRQADLLKEDRNRERIENRRRMFDEYFYEKKHTPTFQQLVEEQNQRNVQRWTNPGFAAGEIWSASALNAVMDDASQLQMKGVSGPEVLLEAAMLANINVGPLGLTGGNVGLLKGKGGLRWPLAFHTESFKKDVEGIDSNLPDAIRDALTGRADASVMKALRDARDRLAVELTANIRDLPAGQYMDAKRFLNNLSGAIALLEQGNAGKYLSNDLAAKGGTVKELVKYMKAHGLEFKPAVDGQEEDYAALHHALAAYDIGAHSQAQQVAEER